MKKVKPEKFYSFKEQMFADDKKEWSVARLVTLAKDLEPFDIDLRGLNMWNLHPKPKTMRSFVGHMQAVLDADLSFPIILDDEGYVMDGRHRIAKAILKGKKTIKAVRFETTPAPCRVNG